MDEAAAKADALVVKTEEDKKKDKEAAEAKEAAAQKAAEAKELADKKKEDDKQAEDAKQAAEVAAALTALKKELKDSKKATLAALEKTGKVGANGDSREAATKARRDAWDRVDKKRGWDKSEIDVEECLQMLWKKYDANDDEAGEGLSQEELVPLVQEVAVVQVRHFTAKLETFKEAHSNDDDNDPVMKSTSELMVHAYETVIADNQRIADDEHCSANRVASIFDKMDTDKNGVLSSKEFIDTAVDTFFTNPETLFTDHLAALRKNISCIKLEKELEIIVDKPEPEPEPEEESKGDDATK